MRSTNHPPFNRLFSFTQPIATSAFFCSRVPILFQKMDIFMNPDRMTANKEGISMTAAPTFIVNVVNIIHANARFDRESNGCSSVEMPNAKQWIVMHHKLTDKVTSHRHNTQSNPTLSQKHPRPLIAQCQLHQIHVHQPSNH